MQQHGQYVTILRIQSMFLVLRLKALLFYLLYYATFSLLLSSAMPPKNKQPTEKNTNTEKVPHTEKFFLLRDISTNVMLILQSSEISKNENTKMETGVEVMYTTKNRMRGRGLILLIGEYSLIYRLSSILPYE